MRQMLPLVPEIHSSGSLIFLGTLCLMSSMECAEVLDTPADFFIGKLICHNDVISPKFLYSVRAITGGTKTYIQALANSFKQHIVFNSKIVKVFREDKGVTLLHQDGQKEIFDDVVFACNADQALALLDRPTESEQALLGCWKYKEGQIVVHKDHSSFPSKELIQAYTYLYTPSETDIMSTSVNGALWFEPYVDNDCDYISTQHPNFEIRDDLICFQGKFRTPIFNFKSVATQAHLPELNGQKHSYYCGSHFGYGLHNDAVTSAYDVARKFGVEGPTATVGAIKVGIKDFFNATKFLGRR